MDERGTAARVGRVVQQLRSFSELHGRELDEVADQLEAAGVPELAARLRVFRGLHADESALVIDELEDLRFALSPPTTEAHQAAAQDPAAQSARRARWLEEQARRASPRPLSRRAAF